MTRARRSGPDCPHPGKYGWDTREDAEFVLPRMVRPTGDHVGCVRAYLCKCGLWHHTSKPLAVGQDHPHGTLSDHPTLQTLLTEMEDPQ